MRRFRLAVVAAMVGLTSPALAADGDPEAGRLLADTCKGCHGIPGYANAYPTYSVPKLGGQHEQYLVSALKAYQSGARGHRTMQAQVSGLSEQQMRDIAAYFASLGPKQATGTQDQQ